MPMLSYELKTRNILYAFQMTNGTIIQSVVVQRSFKPISGRMDRASATETDNLDSIPDRVKPKTMKLVIRSFQLDVQQ